MVSGELAGSAAGGRANETPTPSCYPVLRDWGTLGGLPAFKPEEGGGHGRSACPETPGLHAGYNGGDSGYRPREGEVIP